MKLNTKNTLTLSTEEYETISLFCKTIWDIDEFDSDDLMDIIQFLGKGHTSRLEDLLQINIRDEV